MHYLVRTSPACAEPSLGPHRPENEAITDARFMQRKNESVGRSAALKAALEQRRRLNRALRRGRVDPLQDARERFRYATRLARLARLAVPCWATHPFFSSIFTTLEKSSAPCPAMLCAA